MEKVTTRLILMFEIWRECVGNKSPGYKSYGKKNLQQTTEVAEKMLNWKKTKKKKALDSSHGCEGKRPIQRKQKQNSEE